MCYIGRIEKNPIEMEMFIHTNFIKFEKQTG